MGPDPDYDPERGLLRNLLGAETPAELAVLEAALTILRLAELAVATLEGDYDLGHLRAFHRFIFQDVYPWAGLLRTVNIALTGPFADYRYIEPAAKQVFDDLASEDYLRGLARPRFVNRLAHFLGEVNAIHPFREGNGRAQRAFFSQLARDAGYRIRWEDLDPEENDRACEFSFHHDASALEAMLDRLVEPLPR